MIGATGAQGSGLVRAILQDPARRFTARAITRKPDSEKARALSAQGAEVAYQAMSFDAYRKLGFPGADGGPDPRA